MTEYFLEPASLAKRHRAERRYRLYGQLAIGLALLFLVLIFTSLIARGYGALQQTEMRLDTIFDKDVIGDGGIQADYQKLARNALSEIFPGVKNRKDKRKLYQLLSDGAGYQLGNSVQNDPSIIGARQSIWVLAADDVDMYLKGNVTEGLDESERRLNDRQIAWINALQEMGRLELRFNSRFFTLGDSREPELAGILGAMTGTLFTLLVCFALSFPLGVLAAIYLEEFAPKNWFADLIEININNLAAVPSIVFGLLGLAIFLSLLNMPRSAPLVGGLVLALMTLPTIIIAARAALKSVPPSIRQAALGLGASPMQSVFHHVLPSAMPGILTGAIIGMAQALGETAPLLMIGMVAFIVDIPQSIVDPATALPVQIFIWADSPERAFVEKTAAGILVLLAFLVAMNLSAIILRRRFERRW
ncbi:MAG: phosphate ABC transporter permease PstA [Rhodospirillaceae bacterium]|nr:phosphate ABC transporter permease PstA [Rhodospirillaceae bacterium]